MLDQTDNQNYCSGKLRNLQKLPRYLSGIVTLTIAAYTGECGCWFPSLSGSGWAGLCGVFPSIFVLCSNDLLIEVRSSRS